jgi:conserved domain protein
MPYHKLKRELLKAGFIACPGKGDHEVWSNDGIRVVVTQTREVPPALTRQALEAIERSKQQ